MEFICNFGKNFLNYLVILKLIKNKYLLKNNSKFLGAQVILFNEMELI
jgi:hypothetical protein